MVVHNPGHQAQRMPYKRMRSTLDHVLRSLPLRSPVVKRG